jgi:tetratricopeptide (TPR) repeat protein
MDPIEAKRQLLEEQAAKRRERLATEELEAIRDELSKGSVQDIQVPDEPLSHTMDEPLSHTMDEPIDPSDPFDRLEIERQKLELERQRLELERARIRLEADRARLEGTEEPAPRSRSSGRVPRSRSSARMRALRAPTAETTNPASYVFLGVSALIALLALFALLTRGPSAPESTSSSNRPEVPGPDETRVDPPSVEPRVEQVPDHGDLAPAPSPLTVPDGTGTDQGPPEPAAEPPGDFSSRNWLVIAETRYRAGDLEGTLKASEEALRVEETSEAYFWRGIARLDSGYLPHALEDFERAVLLDSSNALARINRAVVLRGLNRPREAIIDLTVLLEELGDDSDLRGTLFEVRGGAYTEVGDHQLAIDDFTQVLELRPHDPRIREFRAYCLSSAGRLAEALEDYQQAIGDSPLDSERLPGLREAIGELEQALRARQEALAEEMALDLPTEPTSREIGRLLRQWTRAEAGSFELRQLTTWLAEQDLDFGDLDRVAEELTDEARMEGAAEILATRMYLDFRDPEWIHENWRGLRTRFREYTRVFPVRGVDVLNDLPALRSDCRELSGGNLLLEAGGQVTLRAFPRWARSGSFTFRLHVFVDNASGTIVWLGSEQGTWNATAEGDEWVTESGRRVEMAAPLRNGEWNEFVLRVVAEQGNVRNARSIDIHVNGSPLLQQGGLNGDLGSFGVQASRNPVVVSGVGLDR